MKSRMFWMLAGMLAAGATLAAESAAGAEREQQKAKHHRVSTTEVGTSGTEVHAAVHISWGTQEVRVIREFYAPRYRTLPKGLQKKLRRTGQLPPGWQKKYEPFPIVLERQLAVLPTGYHRGVIDGHAVIFNPRSQVIVDVAVLF